MLLVLEPAIVHHAVSDEHVRQIIGDRLYPHVVPDPSLLPAAVYSISNSRAHNAMGGRTAIRSSDVTFTAVANDYATSRDAASRINAAFNGVRGHVGPSGGSVEVQSSSLVNESDSYAPPESGETRPTFMRSVTFAIWWKE